MDPIDASERLEQPRLLVPVEPVETSCQVDIVLDPMLHRLVQESDLRSAIRDAVRRPPQKIVTGHFDRG